MTRLRPDAGAPPGLARCGVPVVLIHGLWLSGRSLALLARRLEQSGVSAARCPLGPVETVRFDYAAVSQSPEQILRHLARQVRALNAPEVHFVCHSLGGLVVRHLLAREPDLPVGRVVTLGTPHTGSRIARRLAHWRLGRTLLGHSLDLGLGGVGLPPPLTVPRPLGQEIGSLAGTLPLGLGAVMEPLVRPHDGSVALCETQIAGLSDHLALKVSHLGMLASVAVAHQIRYFLACGRFAH